MRRREVTFGLAGAALNAFSPARAQAPRKLPKIGVLVFGSSNTRSMAMLQQGLRELGWIDGESVTIEVQVGQKLDELREAAARLVNANADVIIAATSIQVEAVRQATNTIPIVFSAHADPVGVGHIQSLARPGGQATGVSQLMTDIVTKQFEALAEAVPQARRIGVVWNPATPSHRPAMNAIESASKMRHVAVVAAPITTPADLDAAYATMIAGGAEGSVVVSSLLAFYERARIVELAREHRLPAVYGQREYVEAGGLMSYAPDLGDLYRRSASYVDKILKGAKPADLPVEQATRYELWLNIREARALGLTIPPSLLIRADEVIE